MNKVLLNLFLGLGLSISLLPRSASANAYDWEHVVLDAAPSASGSAQIKLDYTTLEYSYYGHPLAQTFALWINVSRQGLSRQDRVRAVLINWPFYASTANEHSEYQMDLEYAEDGRFTGDAKDLLKGANIFNARQAIAIVINGEWLKTASDPTQSNFDFRFIPYRN